MEFVKVPRSLIYNIGLGDKRVIAYLSILFSGWNGKKVSDLAAYSLYSSFRGTGGVISNFKMLVSELLSLGVLAKTEKGIFIAQTCEQFGIVYQSEFNKILAYRKECMQLGKRINHAHLLLLLAYIRLHMIHMQGQPCFYSNLLVRISESTGLSVRSISACLNVLEQLEIVHSEELARYQTKDGVWHSNVRIIVNMKIQGNIKYDWKSEAQRAAFYIRSLSRQNGG
ncbi:MAG: hypothetical protein II453_18180 [Alphaproteobacteria bacterium]|nr:hypothetical protein [Alphaproteobacteria bacterium]